LLQIDKIQYYGYNFYPYTDYKYNDKLIIIFCHVIFCFFYNRFLHNSYVLYNAPSMKNIKMSRSIKCYVYIFNNKNDIEITLCEDVLGDKLMDKVSNPLLIYAYRKC
jgi:hypothetical protein